MAGSVNRVGAASVFSNPWAECWGGGCSGGQAQMQAELNQGRVLQMQASGESEPCQDGENPGPSRPGGVVRVLPVINMKGLHARASAKFVQLVESFDADVTVTRCGETVGGQSIMGLMMLAAARGTTITVEVSGVQAAPCMEAIAALLADKFGEEA